MATAELVPAKQSADNALIAMIVTAAQDKSIEIDRLKELMEMRKDILAQESEQAFNRAMNAAQSEIIPVGKDGENPHAHSRYATLEKVDREIRPIYTKHGFSLTFNTGTPANPAAVHLICEVRHSEGYKKEYFLEGDLDVSGSQGKSNKTSIQGLGSSVSYLRRYLTLMIFNVTLTNEDNDGNATSNKESYDSMRYAADARQAAREAAEPNLPQADRFYREKEPGLDPPHDKQLEASLKQPKKGNDLNAYQIKAAQMFKPLHDKYVALSQEKRYRAQLKSFDVEKSIHFDLSTPGGKSQAERCMAVMIADLKELEERLSPKASDIDVEAR